jgi:uncharacterized protein (DUF1684 family)
VVSGPYAAALIGWRETVAAIYRELRDTHSAGPQAAWARFRERRDELYRDHPCSALTDAEKVVFDGFDYHDYDPQFCFTGEIDYEVEELALDAQTSEGTLAFRRIAVVRFRHRGSVHSLDLYWLDIYGGGLWLPVGDETNGVTSYGGGRYLFDTAKGANLGLSASGKRLLLDFNFLYPPSCSLNSAWICPLCPRPNRLPFEVKAGERCWTASASEALHSPASVSRAVSLTE